ncbi:hypothetical protein [uncultured Megasphaera sp.]|uniref:hypothetical protein n=1 Tax=uncultured Megasphaera sp. TaxID=165188 RepID=UPI0025933672|nr:hypothetical protein [uncultured Megasphaera sp.]
MIGNQIVHAVFLHLKISRPPDKTAESGLESEELDLIGRQVNSTTQPTPKQTSISRTTSMALLVLVLSQPQGAWRSLSHIVSKP